MTTPACARCGRATDNGVCVSCDATADAGSPAMLAMPGRGDSVWTRVLLVFTALVTVGIAAGLLFMTVRNLAGRG